MAKKTKPKPKVKTQLKLKKPAKPAPKAVKKAVKPAVKAKPVKADPKKLKKEDPKAAKKTVPVKVEPKADIKQQAKALTKPASKSKLKSKKVEKKEDDFDDDLINDDFGESEIAEYEDDLKAVEEDDDDLSEELLDDEDQDEKETEVYLTDSEGRRLCRVRDCDQISGVEGYCRYHYLLLWKKIQIRKAILIDGKLEKYIEDLTGRYPDKFLEMIKKDMKTEKDFMSAIQELEIDEAAMGDNDTSDDEAQSFADEIRGVADAPVIEDDGDF